VPATTEIRAPLDQVRRRPSNLIAIIGILVAFLVTGVPAHAAGAVEGTVNGAAIGFASAFAGGNTTLVQAALWTRSKSY
jgi:hypothetical protein